MDVQRFIIVFLAFSVFLFNAAFCWEDAPDSQDFRETDRLYKAACRQVGYNEYELLLQKQQREYDQEYSDDDPGDVSNDGKLCDGLGG